MIRFFIFPKGDFNFYYFEGIDDITNDLDLKFIGASMKTTNEIAKIVNTKTNTKDILTTIYKNYVADDADLDHPEDKPWLEESYISLENITNLNIIKNQIPPTYEEIMLNVDNYYFINQKNYINALKNATSEEKKILKFF